MIVQLSDWVSMGSSDIEDEQLPQAIETLYADACALDNATSTVDELLDELKLRQAAIEDQKKAEEDAE